MKRFKNNISPDSRYAWCIYEAILGEKLQDKA